MYVFFPSLYVHHVPGDLPLSREKTAIRSHLNEAKPSRQRPQINHHHAKIQANPPTQNTAEPAKPPSTPRRNQQKLNTRQRKLDIPLRRRADAHPLEAPLGTRLPRGGHALRPRRLGDVDGGAAVLLHSGERELRAAGPPDGLGGGALAARGAGPGDGGADGERGCVFVIEDEASDDFLVLTKPGFSKGLRG